MATKTEYIIFFVLFYTITGLISGYIGTTLAEDTGIETTNSLSAGSFSVTNVVTGFTSLPVWFNTIFFGSFTLILVWLIVSSTALFSGSGS